jgi:GNAT superfamily N-acetyltransferase
MVPTARSRVIERVGFGLRARLVKRLWFRGLSRAKMYRRLILVERMLSEPVPEISLSMRVTVEVLTSDKIAAYRALRPQQDPAEVTRRLEKGDWCFAVWHEGCVIHVAWAAARRATIEYLARAVELAPDQVYVYDIFTAPAFRQTGVASLRSVEMMRYFRERGYRRLLGAVSPENRSAFRQNVGYRRVGVIGFLGVGPWHRAFCRTNQPTRPPESTDPPS